MWTIGALAVAGLGVSGAVLAKVFASADVREVRLVVRGMTYYAAQSTEENPTLRLVRGEKIRLVLTNEDPGYSHNLVAPVLGVSTPLLEQGKSQSVEFRVPDVSGVYSYECGPHSQMMRGTIAIE
jgi:plastocyanin